MEYDKNQVYDYIREVFTSDKFQAMSDLDKQSAINQLVDNPLILSNNISRDDIVKLYDEQLRLQTQSQIQLSTDTLKKLGRDPLFLILSRLAPKDVLSLCQTTPAYARLCQDPTTFSRLMKLHYPGYFETDDPKRQYMAISNFMETTYMADKKKIFWTGNNGELKNTDGVQNDEQWAMVIQIGITQKPWLTEGFKYDPDVLFSAFWFRMLGPGYIPPQYVQFLVKAKIIRPESKDDLMKRLLDPESRRKLAERLALSIRAREGKVIVDFKWTRRSIIDEYGLDLSSDDIQKLVELGKIRKHDLDRSNYDSYRNYRNTGLVFSIYGNPIPKGTWAWILIEHKPRSSSQMNERVEVYKTKEGSVKGFISRNYNHLLGILVRDFVKTVMRDRANNTNDINAVRNISNADMVNNIDFNKYLNREGVINPFTREKLYEYCIGTERYHMYSDPNQSNERYLFRRVAFN